MPPLYKFFLNNIFSIYNVFFQYWFASITCHFSKTFSGRPVPYFLPDLSTGIDPAPPSSNPPTNNTSRYLKIASILTDAKIKFSSRTTFPLPPKIGLIFSLVDIQFVVICEHLRYQKSVFCWFVVVRVRVRVLYCKLI